MHINNFKPSEEYGTHAHENFEFHYIAEGEGEVGFLTETYDADSVVQIPAIVKSQKNPNLKEFRLGQRKSEEKDYVIYKIQKGDAFLNPPKQFCWQKSSRDNPLVEYAIRFSFDIFNLEDDEAGKYFRKENSIIRKLLCQMIIQVTSGNEQVRKIFESVFLEAKYMKPGYITMIKNEIFNLIILIARSSWDKRHLKYYVPEIDHTKKRQQLIEDYIIANIRNNIKIEDLAKNVNMSNRNLSRVIKDIKGVSVHKYIVQIKVNKAVEILTNTKMTLTEVAVLTGFSSPYHLSRTVKKYIGRNPSEL